MLLCCLLYCLLEDLAAVDVDIEGAAVNNHFKVISGLHIHKNCPP